MFGLPKVYRKAKYRRFKICSCYLKVINELRRIVEDSEIMAEDDNLWPQPDRVGRQVSNRSSLPNLTFIC